MAVAITKRPSIISNGNPVSRYTVSDQPIYYTFAFSGIDFVAYPAYKLLILIYDLATDNLLGSRYFRPIDNGSNNVDLQKFIKPYLSSIYNPEFISGDNFAEQGTMLQYYIKYQEIFDSNTAGTTISDETNYINVVLATKQIGAKYGQNFGDYAPLDTPDLQLAKFATEFKEPVMFKGWPFTLSFLYSTEMGAVDLKKVITNRDINLNEISESETQLDITQVGNMNWLKIGSNLPSNVYYLDVKLETGDVHLNEYVSIGYVDHGYTVEL